MTATLDVIRSKVRSITARPSVNQITDAEIDFYINTFYLYDFPEHLRLQSLKVNYTFATNPNVERYAFPVELFISNETPIFMGGYQLGFYQDQQVFYALWPKINFSQDIGTGDGATVAPALTNLSNTPVIPGSVTISTIIGGDSFSYFDNENGSFLQEGTSVTGITQAATAVITSPFHSVVNGDTVFVSGVYGMSQINGGPYVVTAVAGDNITINLNSSGFSPYLSGGAIQRQNGTIDYITGAVALDFGIAPDNGANIQAMYIPYVASRPRDVLFFNNSFFFRPVPDRAYKVEVVAYRPPTEMLESSQSPEIRQWWQLLSLGASLKIFEDNGDLEQYSRFRPAFEEQMILVNRRTIKQQTSKRVATAYADGISSASYGLFYDVWGS